MVDVRALFDELEPHLQRYRQGRVESARCYGPPDNPMILSVNKGAWGKNEHEFREVTRQTVDDWALKTFGREMTSEERSSVVKRLIEEEGLALREGRTI